MPVRSLQPAARRSCIRSKNFPQPWVARSYSSGVIEPRCSNSISVRPSPRSVSTTLTSSKASSPGWSVTVKTSRSGGSTSRYSPLQSIRRRSGGANIVSRHPPPGRTSIDTLESGTWHSGPPYQSAKLSGSVHSLHTRSRGASNTRVILIPYSLAPAAEGSLIASCILLGANALVKPIKTCLPEPLVETEPINNVLQRLNTQSRQTQLCQAPAYDQPHTLKHSK